MSFHFWVTGLVGLLSCAVSSDLLAIQNEEIPNDAWSQFGGPQRTFSVTGVKSTIDRTREATQLPGDDWIVSLGSGASGAVVSGDRVVTMYSVPAEPGKDWNVSGTEYIATFQLSDGEKLWEQGYPVTAHADQDGFDKTIVRPLGTPCVANGVVIALGFTGILTARSLEDGIELWRHDLVADFEASPVQYGFSASPLIHDNRLFVHVGGRQAAVICFDVLTGIVVWKSEPDAPSYASPAIRKVCDRYVLVQLTGNALMLVDPLTGTTLLKHSLKKSGLTNVPTPICLPDDHILLGCQGNNGTSLLKITSDLSDANAAGSILAATEVWTNNKLSFFYCNWVSHGELVAGFQGKTLTTFDWKTGRIISQQREFTDSNLIRLQDRWLVLRGDGLLCRCQHDDQGLTTIDRLQATTDRCWTPPSVINSSMILIRTEKSLMRLSLDRLSVDAETATDLEFTSMDAMYGGQPEVINQLMKLIESSDEAAATEQLHALQKSAPLALNSATLRKLFAIANSRKLRTLSAEIVETLRKLDRRSRVLPELELALFIATGRGVEADQIRRTQLVKVPVRIQVPAETPVDSVITIAGNRPSLGEWEPDRIFLQRNPNGEYETELWMAPGTIELKVTRGTWETVEVRKDGAKQPNRSFEVANGTQLNIVVERWQ